MSPLPYIWEKGWHFTYWPEHKSGSSRVYSSVTNYLPCLKLLRQSILELTSAQGVGDHHTNWQTKQLMDRHTPPTSANMLLLFLKGGGGGGGGGGGVINIIVLTICLYFLHPSDKADVASSSHPPLSLASFALSFPSFPDFDSAFSALSPLLAASFSDAFSLAISWKEKAYKCFCHKENTLDLNSLYKYNAMNC